MERRRSQLIALFYDPETRKVWSRGRFVALEEFAKYPPKRREDIVPSEGDAPESEPVPDPDDVEPEPGATVKCIGGKEHVCYFAVCYATGRSC